MSERKAGWYWVRSPRLDGAWEIADLDANMYWYFAGCDIPQAYEFVSEIGPRIPTPDEPWQCVPVEPTGEMVLAYAREGGDAENAAFDWRTMLAAAPKPEDA